MKIVTKINVLANKLSHSFKRFPVTLLFATLMVGVLIFMNHLDFNLEKSRDIYTRVSMALALGIPLSLSLHVFLERNVHVKTPVKILSHIAVMVVLSVYYFLFLKNQEMVTMTRYVAYTIALYMLFSIIPYFRKKTNYELYVIKLFTRFVTTYVYSIVLYLGIVAILVTINLLFNADIPGEVFADMALIVAGIFAPAFFLADVPRREEEVLPESYPKVLSILLQFIILPLISVYTIILYVYFGKIVITRQLPQGIIGNLVLWYSIVSTIVLFFIYPLRKKSQWIKSFINIFPKAILPLLAMMFVAIAIRINAYGITENRYFVLIVGLWVTGVMIYYSVKKDIINIFVTISLAIVAVLTVTGPWSAYSVSKSSQNKRFEEIVKRYDMIDQSGNIKNSEDEFSQADQVQVSGIISYFNHYHDLEDIKYLPADFEISDMKNLFGFDLKDDGLGFDQSREYFNYFLERRESLVDIKDFDYFTTYEIYSSESFQQSNGDYNIAYDHKEKELIIKNKEKILYKTNLEKVVSNIHNKNKGKATDKERLKEEEMAFKDENKEIKIQVVFKNLSGFENRSTDEVNLESAEFYTFIKFK